MINKQKIWFLTLFSIILVLAVYYIALPEASLSNLIESSSSKSANVSVTTEDDDILSALRVEDDEMVLSQMEELQKLLLDDKTNADEKNNAYEKLQNINLNKGKEDELEKLILNTYNLKSFIKIKDDQINVTVSSKNGSYKAANDIIRTIQKEFKDKKYITIKYQ